MAWCTWCIKIKGSTILQNENKKNISEGSSLQNHGRKYSEALNIAFLSTNSFVLLNGFKRLDICSVSRSWNGTNIKTFFYKSACPREKGFLSDGADNLKSFYFHKDAFLVSLQRNEKCAAVKRGTCTNGQGWRIRLLSLISRIIIMYLPDY